jgi:hypothetical protein
MTLAFIVGLIISLNEPNMKLQWKGELLWKMFSQVKAFGAKLNLLHKHQCRKCWPLCNCQIIFTSSTSQGRWQTLKDKFAGIIQ